MKKASLYSALLFAALCMPAAADITVLAPTAAAVTPQQGNCDLLATNIVRATYVGQQDMAGPAASPTDTLITERVAVFEVIENLAHHKYVRYGDGSLEPGYRFTVTMNRELPGQPAQVVDTIMQMQPGEESVMRIDHLYMMGNREGYPIRACSRMARRNAIPAVNTGDTAAPAPSPAPADESVPTTAAPLTAPQPQINRRSESVRMMIDGNGNMQTVRTVSSLNPATGQMETHMYINGTEVDPQTQQPLAPAAAPAAPAAAPAETPAPQQPAAEQHDDDTVIEGHPAEQVSPAAPQTVQPAAPQTPPAPAEGDGF